MGTQNRGFASMDESKQREIASKGGKAQSREVKAAAGRKGGEAQSREAKAKGGRSSGNNR